MYEVCSDIFFYLCFLNCCDYVHTNCCFFSTLFLNINSYLPSLAICLLCHLSNSCLLMYGHRVVCSDYYCNNCMTGIHTLIFFFVEIIVGTDYPFSKHCFNFKMTLECMSILFFTVGFGFVWCINCVLCSGLLTALTPYFCYFPSDHLYL